MVNIIYHWYFPPPRYSEYCPSPSAMHYLNDSVMQLIIYHSFTEHIITWLLYSTITREKVLRANLSLKKFDNLFVWHVQYRKSQRIWSFCRCCKRRWWGCARRFSSCTNSAKEWSKNIDYGSGALSRIWLEGNYCVLTLTHREISHFLCFWFIYGYIYL